MQLLGHAPNESPMTTSLRRVRQHDADDGSHLRSVHRLDRPRARLLRQLTKLTATTATTLRIQISSGWRAKTVRRDACIVSQKSLVASPDEIPTQTPVSPGADRCPLTQCGSRSQRHLREATPKASITTSTDFLNKGLEHRQRSFLPTRCQILIRYPTDAAGRG